MASQFGLSPRGIAMGNAVSAVADDFSAVYYNPAGLALREEDDLTVGYFFSHPRVQARDAAGAQVHSVGKDIHAFLFGYRKNLRNLLPLRWRRNLGLGIAVELLDDLKKAALVRTSSYREPEFPVIGRVQDVLVAGAGLGLELHKRLLLGAGMRIAVTLDVQDVAVIMRLPQAEFEYLNLDANIDTEARPVVGLLLRPLDSLRLAAVWRKGGPIARVDVKGVGLGELGPLKATIPFLFAFRDFYSPEEIAGSIALEPLPKLLLAAELTWARWSGNNTPYNEKPPGDPFRDVLIPRLGVEYAPASFLKVQAGYYYQPSPVRSSQPATCLLDTEQHVFSLGAESSRRVMQRVFNTPFLFRAFVQFQHLPHRRLQTLNGEITVWGSILSLGGVVQVPF